MAAFFIVGFKCYDIFGYFGRISKAGILPFACGTAIAEVPDISCSIFLKSFKHKYRLSDRCGIGKWADLYS